MANLEDEGNLLHTPAAATPIQPISDFLEPIVDADEGQYMVPEKTLLKHGHAFDIVKPSSRRSCCFTKGDNRDLHRYFNSLLTLRIGYYHFVEATGSILQLNEELNVREVAIEKEKTILFR